MHKTTVIVIGIVLFIACWLIWSSYKKTSISDPWDVISSHAAIIIESNDYASTSKKIGKEGGVKSLSIMEEELIVKIPSFFSNRKLLLALYFQSKTIEPLFIIPDLEKKNREKLSGDGIKRRNFSGYVIHDLYKNNTPIFSVAFIDELTLVGAAFLIEDAIRIVNSDQENLYKEKYKSLFQLATRESDDGNIYVNVPQLFTQVGKKIDTSVLNNFAFGGIADLKIDEDQLFLNGFLIDSLQTSSFLSLFKNQTPKNFSMKDVISVKANFINHYSFSDFNLWARKRELYIDKYLPSLKREISNIEKDQTLNFASLQKDMGDEVSLCFAETPQGELSPLILIKTKGNALDNEIVDWQNEQEHYSEFIIHQLKAPTLAKCLLWPIAPIDDLGFYCTISNYAIFAADERVLKDFLSDFELDNTLSKSLEWNKFLSSSMQESSVSFFFTGGGARMMSKSQSIRFFDSFDLNSIDKGAIQFSGLDDHFYVNAIINLKEKKKRELNISEDSPTDFNGDIIRSPNKVINHIDKSSEILFQDSLNSIYLVSSQNQILWSLDIKQKIKGDVHQIDFYKNSKLQYFFTTENQLHLIDRLGRDVNGFPQQLNLKSDQIKFSQVIDYDHTRNYRFMVVSRKGDVYLFDQRGKTIDTWNPKSFSSNIIEANHYRIDGKDYFLIIQENGILNLFNRTGDIVKNFPVLLDVKVRGCFVVKKRKASYFSIIGEDGMLINVDMTGKVIRKEPLVRNYAQSRFGVVTSDRSDINQIFRIDKTKFALFDEDGKMLFEKENPASEQIEMKLFNDKKSILAVVDFTQDLLMLLDKTGKEILAQPLVASQFPTIEFLSADKVKVHYVYKKQLRSVVVSL